MKRVVCDRMCSMTVIPDDPVRVSFIRDERVYVEGCINGIWFYAAAVPISKWEEDKHISFGNPRNAYEVSIIFSPQEVPT